MSVTKRLDLDHEISKAEKEAMKAKEKLAKLRRRLPGLEIEDYTLLDAAGEKVALSSLFGEKDELIYDFCSVWHLFDLLPSGRAGWEPKFKY